MNSQVINIYQNFQEKKQQTQTHIGKSVGHSGSYSTNYQIAGRELLTQDEIRMLDNDKAILMIRGEKPIIDRKYDILKHPNVKDTTDGQAKAYEHGKMDRANASILKIKPEEIDIRKIKDIQNMQQVENVKIELLSDEEIENYFLMEEYQNERKKESNQ